MHPDQRKLCERLYLLKKLEYCGVDPIHPVDNASEIVSNRANRLPSTNLKIHLLNFVALLLTSGKGGDVTAVGFCNDSGDADATIDLSMVAAKNTTPSIEQQNHAKELMSFLKEDNLLEDKIIRRVYSTCKENIAKRVKRVEKSLGLLWTTGGAGHTGTIDRATAILQLVEAEGSQPSSNPAAFQNELRGCANSCHAYRALCDNHDEAGALDAFLREILPKVRLLSSNPLKTKLQRLAAVTEDLPDLDRGRIFKLRRHLNKCLQYHSGAKTFLIFNLAERATLSITWITCFTPQAGDDQLTLTKPCSRVAEDALEELSATGKYSFNTADIRRELLARLEEGDRVVKLPVHAEIQVVLESLTQRSGASTQNQPSVTRRREFPVSCSKRSCLSCNLWIGAFNISHDTNWLTAGSHGKPYHQWALPTYDRRGLIGEVVIGGITERLAKKVVSGPGVGEQLSDEYASTPSENSPHMTDREFEGALRSN